jgi:hypothetical protein
MEATSDRTETAAAEALRRPIDLYCQHLHRGVRGSLAIGYLRQISDDQDQLAAFDGPRPPGSLKPVRFGWESPGDAPLHCGRDRNTPPRSRSASIAYRIGQ